MSDPLDPPVPEEEPSNGVVDTPFDTALSDRYLVYAMSTITARSLPDLRDGLKPVHRRLLWAMRQLKLDPTGAYKKSARVVGDTIGKYHPHGDTVDGQGNFGNIDGDNVAAYRYTEARLTASAIELMAGLDDGGADYRPTYNNEDDEPELFPGLFPNLLANGASGIAVGMATNIPPHNVAEIIDAAAYLIDEPRCEPADLMQFVQGPDFPTGGVVVDSAQSIAESYRTGRGSFRLRARFAGKLNSDGKWEVEPEKLPNGTWQLVVTEIPYQVQKGKLIEAIAALINDKKLPILEDVRDESDEVIRIVIEPKSRNVDPDVLMESLYKLTDLEVKFSLNLNVLGADRTPRVMGLKTVLSEWLTHQIIVLVRRAQHRLAKIDDRVELLEGYLIAYLNLDRVIEIIRNEDEPKPVMIAEFNDRQAEAILNMRLRSLRRLEEMEIKGEREKLLAERADLQALIDSPARQKTKLKKDLAALRVRYAPETRLGKRRTLIEEAAPARDIPLEAMIEREPITVIMSSRGWVRAMKGHVALDAADAVKFKEGDGPAFAFHAQTTDKILLIAEDGRVFTLGGDKLPGGRGFGEPVRLMIDLSDGIAIANLFPARPDDRILLAASDGKGFIARSAEVIAETRKGRQVVNLRTGAKLAVARIIGVGHDYLAAVGDNRKLVVFPLEELPEMTRGQGVTLQKYRDGGLSDATSFTFAEGLSWAMGGDSGRTRTEADLTLWRVARGAGGRMPPTGFPRDNKFG
jgi:topoisomerase IV subunit A